ncbi:MAG: hypothetical protein CMG66_02735 [Candidatus Marinimicrobia bacterium]|nr:hypothetical protein [Candidatus Neomarinimicrobiota bacterium]|tara:strand:- start:31756 stop:32028 length:273 start_codon:yes stop_codon:yes gene_type:complete
MQKKNLYFILLVIFIGCIMGTALSMFVSLVIPDGVVKDFFILSKSFGFGQNANNWLVLGPLRLKMGLFFDVSILSILGIFISWYILRYFK